MRQIHARRRRRCASHERKAKVTHPHQRLTGIDLLIRKPFQDLVGDAKLRCRPAV